MDLSTLDKIYDAQEEGVEVELRHPVTDEPLGVFVTVAGPDSKRSRDARRKMTNRALQRRKPTAEEMERSALEFLADITIGWRTLVKTDDGLVSKPVIVIAGQEVSFSRSAFVEACTRWNFIQAQVDEVAVDRSNFLKS